MLNPFMQTFLHFAVDSYDWLVNGTAQARVEKFMEEEHSFDEYTQVIINPFV